MPQCTRCGEYHATPRQNKNCERRNRRYSQSPLKAPKSTQFRFGGQVQSRNRGRLYRKW